MSAAPRGVVGLLLALACCASEREPSGASQSGGSTTGVPDACIATEDCPEAFCVASWDAELAQRGAAECVAECIAVDDLTRFCIDDASCCEGMRCNRADGLCAPASEASSSTSESGTTTDMTTTASTSGSSTGTGSGSLSSSG